ncbi:sce7725 family protein [Proteus mirabilis]|uniref:sce7725 family protein n=2 Tax=Proteus mirabilis TaxID=584 RepID=UPI001179983B|nr:sce7725 family protein [Proteus mirabilis]EKU6442459.1 sce7725 family protein [Proteus mirabilis]EKW4024345.1 sce7725 family protein [Proteus mirabilis]EKX6520071.1 sce7725 family protein [Proteus mirabilis]MBI6241399.1 sce7725 family protein [Proteus mirabilis]MCI9739639.1 sce7725 family protein [Proteus mirabilis]
MYYPYMRGKQFELAALKEVAPRLNPTKVSPIIEPINDNLDRLSATITVLNNHNVIPHVIVNPQVGDLANDSPDPINTELSNRTVSFIPCIRLHNQNILHINTLLQKLISGNIPYSLYLQEEIQSNITHYTNNSVANIIQNLNKYSHTFRNSLLNSVVVESSFPSQARNADYSRTPQFFSDAHSTYINPLIQHQIGFGDFLTIDDVWSTTGGPAFVIALHITYITQSNSSMYVKHSLSTKSPNDQSDPAGKFKEALQEMINFANVTPTLDQNTLGFQEYINIHNNGTYHGLGVPKKLSMMHHIETINNNI